MTIVLNSTFLNSFGDSGAAISLNQGGALYCKYCHFEMDEKYRQYDDNFIVSLKDMRQNFDWDLNWQENLTLNNYNR